MARCRLSSAERGTSGARIETLRGGSGVSIRPRREARATRRAGARRLGLLDEQGRGVRRVARSEGRAERVSRRCGVVRASRYALAERLGLLDEQGPVFVE